MWSSLRFSWLSWCVGFWRFGKVLKTFVVVVDVVVVRLGVVTVLLLFVVIPVVAFLLLLVPIRFRAPAGHGAAGWNPVYAPAVMASAGAAARSSIPHEPSTK